MRTSVLALGFAFAAAAPASGQEEAAAPRPSLGFRRPRHRAARRGRRAMGPIHHFCKPIRSEPVVIQCILFETMDPNAPMTEVEYIVAKSVTRNQIDREEWNRAWHDHAMEIASGRVQVHDMPEEEAAKIAELVSTTDGLIFHLWPPGSDIPTGEVSIAQAVSHVELSEEEFEAQRAAATSPTRSAGRASGGVNRTGRRVEGRGRFRDPHDPSRLPSRRPRLVRAPLPGRPFRPAGARLARDPLGPPHADRGADRIGKDAGRLPVGDRRAGAPGPLRRGGRSRRAARRDADPLRLAPQGAGQRHPQEPRRAALGDPRGAPSRRGSPTSRSAPPCGRATRPPPSGPRMLRRPPHILRHDAGVALHPADDASTAARCCRPSRTVIVDEIHAVADDKRGSHLALSLERLEHLVVHGVEGDVHRVDGKRTLLTLEDVRSRPAGRPPVRIGLSATQRPIEDVARFLVGERADDAGAAQRLRLRDRRRGPRPRDRPADRGPALAAQAVASGEVWEEVYDRLAELIAENRTTLVFVNTRRLAERVDAATSRSGSARSSSPRTTAASRRSGASTRRTASRRGAQGARRDGVARARDRHRDRRPGRARSARRTRSPRSSSGSAGRAASRARWPAGACSRSRATSWSSARRCSLAAREGRLDRLIIPERPLDILAQQIVAAVACRGLGRRRSVRARRGARGPTGTSRARTSMRSSTCWPTDTRPGAAAAPPASTATPSTASHPRPARRADRGGHLRRRDSGRVGLPGRPRSRGDRDRHDQRGLRDRVA